MLSRLAGVMVVGRIGTPRDRRFGALGAGRLAVLRSGIAGEGLDPTRTARRRCAVTHPRTFLGWPKPCIRSSPSLSRLSVTTASTTSNGGRRERRAIRGDQAMGPLGR